MKRLLLILVFLFYYTGADSAILFEDSFDGWTTGFSTYPGQIAESPWWVGQSSTLPVCNSVSPPTTGGMGVIDSGCVSGKCWQTPRCQNASSGYYGTINYSIINNLGTKTDLYLRWYNKYESGFDKTASLGFKTFDRVTIHNGSTAYPLYIGHGLTGPSGKISTTDFYLEVLNYPGVTKYRLADYEDFYNDHQWHAFELRIKLNTSGNSDGIITSWLDGVQQYNYTNVNFSAPGSLYFQQVHFGLGNVTNEQEWDQTTWKSMYWDEFAIGDSYIGPIGGGSFPPVLSNAQLDGSPPAPLPYGTTSAAMSWDTDTNSTCKLGTTPGETYAEKSNTADTTGGTSHSETVTGLTNDSTVNYYIRCDNGDVNTSDYTITVTVSGEGPTPGENPILSESFEDSNFASRDWYDGNSTAVVAGGQSGNCLQWTWQSGNSYPNNTSTTGMRKLFTASDEIFVSFYIKTESTWQGHQETYGGPHMINILSDYDDDYNSLARADLNTYLELFSNVGAPYTTYPRFGLQDSLQINTSYGTPPNDLVGTTEDRDVSGCNGTVGDTGTEVSCYNDGNWKNGRIWTSLTPVTKNTWQQHEVYLKMNTVSGGVSYADGVLQYWVDDTLVMNYNNIVYRTNSQANKKWRQVILAPFMGSSPITQTVWIDELEITTDIPIPVNNGKSFTGTMAGGTM